MDMDLNAAADMTADTQQLFRVHKFIMAHHSPVFADMLSMPAPPDVTVNDIYEGVPLVALSDRASDLASLLNALYNPSYVIIILPFCLFCLVTHVNVNIACLSTLPYKRLDPDTPFLTEGILRLATKYQMEPLRVRLLEHFTADWPRTLDEWEGLERQISATESRHVCKGGLHLDDRFPEPVAAIRIAREYGCQEILPAAFYRVARTPISDDWDNLRRDGTTDSALQHGRLTVRWVLLDRGALMQVLSVREILTSEMVVIHSELLCGSFCGRAHCSTEDRCVQALGRLRENMDLSIHQTLDPLHILNVCAANGGTQGYDDGVCLCPWCQTELKEFVDMRKQHVWTSLRKLFQLEPN